MALAYFSSGYDVLETYLISVVYARILSVCIVHIMTIIEVIRSV